MMMMIRCEEEEEEEEEEERRKQKEGKTRGGLFVQFYIYTYNSLLLPWWYHS